MLKAIIVRPLRPVLSVLAFGVLAACQTPPTGPAPAADRQQMARAHDDMAACLRSATPMDACMAQMREHCKSMGQEGCGMMGMQRGQGPARHEGAAHAGPGRDERHAQ